MHNKQKTCLPSEFLHDTTCIQFVWVQLPDFTKTSLSRNCQPFNSVSNTSIYISIFQCIFDAVATEFPPLIVPHLSQHGFYDKLTYMRHSNVYVYKNITITVMDAKGFHICVSDKKKIMTGKNVFHCKDGSYVSYFFVCDGNLDCHHNSSDEGHSLCIENIRQQKACGQHTVKKHQQNTTPPERSATFGKKRGSTNEAVLCDSGLELDVMLKNDLVPDCGPGGEDEPLLASLLQMFVIQPCLKPYELPCEKGHSKCYNITEICIYRFDHLKHMTPCRNGAHLQNCRNFHCNNHFKCQDSFCISWAHVCDGKWDCPFGQEEINTHICEESLHCIGIYKCRGERPQCVPLINVCDEFYDCLIGDDEYFCELETIHCPLKCCCFLLAMECEQLLFQQLHLSYPHIFLSIHYSPTIGLKQVGRHFTKAQYFNMTSNDIDKVCRTLLPSTLLLLDVGYNRINTLVKGCFPKMAKLKTIFLNKNKLINVEGEAFVDVINLHVLDLSNNPLSQLPDQMFTIHVQIKKILMLNIILTDIGNKLFSRVQDAFIETSDYHVCCLVHKSNNCSAQIPWYISCKDILPETTMKIAFSFASLYIFLVNCLLIVLNKKFKDSKLAYLVIAISINANKIICSLYLSIIQVVDLVFKNIFVVKEQIWRKHSICFVAFGVLLLFSLLSQILQQFLSLSQLMVVVHPIDTKFKRTRFVSKFVAFVLMAVLAVTLSMSLISKYYVVTLPTSLCLPFIDPTHSIIVIKVITWCIVLTQIFTPVIVVVLHCLLVSELQMSEKRITDSKSKGKSHAMMFLQLITTSTSNILCWIPSSSFYISSMFLSNYPMDLVIWVTVGVLPINSIIIPTISSILCLFNLWKSWLKNYQKKEIQKCGK